jgi:hypothetical protein
VFVGVLVFSTLRNTTMTSTKSAAALLTIAALSPALSNASPERVSVKACAAAFAASIAAPGAKPAGFKLEFRPGLSTSLADFYPSEFTFTLEARNPTTGVAFARANCSADSRGAVTSLSVTPLDGKVAAR